MSVTKPFVLLIEDDAASAEALTMILRDWGAEVAHAQDASALPQALGARASTLHCIITDFHLGDGPDGVALAQDVRALAPRSRVLVLSGSFHGRAMIAAQAAGFHFMHKPARADDILAWLEKR
ncbi:MAG: response regulator [Hyphomonadaceae bacterium]